MHTQKSSNCQTVNLYTAGLLTSKGLSTFASFLRSGKRRMWRSICLT